MVLLDDWLCFRRRDCRVPWDRDWDKDGAWEPALGGSVTLPCDRDWDMLVVLAECATLGLPNPVRLLMVVEAGCGLCMAKALAMMLRSAESSALASGTEGGAGGGGGSKAGGGNGGCGGKPGPMPK